MFTRQFLAENVGVAAVAEKALPQPVVQTVERRPAHRLAIGHNTAFAQVTTNRVARAAKLLCNPFRSPAAFMKAQHRHNFFCLKHRLSLHCSPQCRCRRNLDLHPFVLSKERGNSSFRLGVNFSFRLTRGSFQPNAGLRVVR
jgi:hypothetical protein